MSFIKININWFQRHIYPKKSCSPLEFERVEIISYILKITNPIGTEITRFS